MDDNESAAIADVLFELRTRALGPGWRIEIGHNDLVLREVGMKAGEVALRWWRGEHRDLEEPRVFELFFQDGRGELPVVVRAAALAIEQKHLDGNGCGGKRQREKDGVENNNQKLPHDRFSKPRLTGFNAGNAE